MYYYTHLEARNRGYGDECEEENPVDATDELWGGMRRTRMFQIEAKYRGRGDN